MTPTVTPTGTTRIVRRGYARNGGDRTQHVSVRSPRTPRTIRYTPPADAPLMRGGSRNTQAIADLALRGFRPQDIANRLGLTHTSVYRCLRRHGLPRNPPLTVRLVVRTLALYAAGESIPEIVRDTGLSENVIAEIVRESARHLSW